MKLRLMKFEFLNSIQHFQNIHRYNAGLDTLYKISSVTFEYLSLTFERLAPLDEIQFKLKLTSHSHFQLDRVKDFPLENDA